MDKLLSFGKVSDSMSIVQGLVGLLVIFGLCYFLSFDRKHIKYKNVAIMLVAEVILALVLFRTSLGLTILNGIASGMDWLMAQGIEGVNFVFGGIQLTADGFVFFLHVLAPLVFITALIGVLNWLGVLPFVVKWVGFGINKLTGAGELESYFPIASTVFGTPTNYLSVVDQVRRASEKQLFTLAVIPMSVVTVSMLAAYMKLVKPRYVVVGVLMQLLSALAVSVIVNPYNDKEEIAKGAQAYQEREGIEGDQAEEAEGQKEKEPFFSMLSDYMVTGWNTAVIVAVMLIGFVALISMLNSLFEGLINISFTELVGYVFSPFAFLMGVPKEDMVQAGSVMAQKVLANEVVAMTSLSALEGLSEKTAAIMGTYCMSFANFGTLGMVIGGVKAIDAHQGNVVAKYSLKIVLVSTLASMVTATIVGFLF
ncbi:NupC/NupG family nucleoside CNT transporter [Aerococcus tenax]|nr:NupC/NupG family nucleoside CNT transporter [Aerococcus urinae]